MLNRTMCNTDLMNKTNKTTIDKRTSCFLSRKFQISNEIADRELRNSDCQVKAPLDCGGKAANNVLQEILKVVLETKSSGYLGSKCGKK